MAVEYVPVAEDEGYDPIEIPTEAGGVLLLSTLSAQFPGLSGLRYRNPDTNAMRAVRLTDGVLYPPPEFTSWSHNGNVIYLCTFPKDNKRKVDEDLGDAPGFRPKKADRKKCTDLIVLGLPYKANEEDLKAYFSKFGELVMTQIKRDMQGGSRGYGFIRFVEFESQIECLTCPRHQILNRWCEVKVPISQGEPAAPASVPRRVFVGGVTEEMTSQVLKDFFSEHGTVEEVYIPKPFRNFAFVTFADSTSVDRLVGQDFVINGTSVHVGTANPRHGGPGSFGSGGGFGFGAGGGGGQGRNFRGRGGAVSPMRGRGWQPMSGGGAVPIGSGGGGYQNVVNALASNPQVLLEALAQATNMAAGGSGAAGGGSGNGGRGGFGGRGGDQGSYGNYW